MTSQNRGVPRADHVPANEQDESIRLQNSEPADATGGDSAVKRGHGAHGTGDDREEKLEADSPKPDFTKGTDRGGSAAGAASHPVARRSTSVRPTSDWRMARVRGSLRGTFATLCRTT